MLGMRRGTRNSSVHGPILWSWTTTSTAASRQATQLCQAMNMQQPFEPLPHSPLLPPQHEETSLWANGAEDSTQTLCVLEKQVNKIANAEYGCVLSSRHTKRLAEGGSFGHGRRGLDGTPAGAQGTQLWRTYFHAGWEERRNQICESCLLITEGSGRP